jgi:hypothetical protein
MALFTINSALFLLKHDINGKEPEPGDPLATSLQEAMTAALEVALEIAARIEPAGA